jgi:hypothetical protein
MNFKKWVKSIQTAGYNGARMIFTHSVEILRTFVKKKNLQFIELHAILFKTTSYGCIDSGFFIHKSHTKQLTYHYKY